MGRRREGAWGPGRRGISIVKGPRGVGMQESKEVGTA